MKYKMIIYDCDGVIFNSEKANFEYYKYLFERFNIPPVNENDNESIRILHTYSNDKVIEYFAKDKNLRDKIINFSRTTDYSKFYPHMTFEPGFSETCKKLKKAGYKIGVATNRSYTFKGIVKFFKLYELIDDYVTALDVEIPKPAPDMIHLILKKNNLKKNDALFIGDSLIDYNAAQNAGVDFIFYKFKHKDCNYIDSHVEIFNYL